jgi:hypothetical protein
MNSNFGKNGRVSEMVNEICENDRNMERYKIIAISP